MFYEQQKENYIGQVLLQDTFLYKLHIIFIESDHISQIQKKKKEQEENGV